MTNANTCLTALGAAILLATSSGALAKNADGNVLIDDVVVSARGTQSTLSLTPGGIGVAKKEEIILQPNESIADAISRIPGLSKNSDSPWGSAINIRGLSGTSVIILVDGVRINTASEINARLAFINPMDVERIEVLKGPISALYGSGSTGGIVNIITKKASYSAKSKTSGEVIGRVSSNGSGNDSYFRVAHSDADSWLQVSGATRNHHSYKGGDDTEIANSQYQDVSLRIAGSTKINNQLEAKLQIMHMDAKDVGIPGGSSTMPANAPVTYPDTKNTLISLDTSYKPDSDFVESIDFNLHYVFNERHVRIDNPAPPISKITPNADHTTFGAKLQSSMNFGDHAIVAGADISDWHMESNRQKYFVAGTIIEDQPTPDTHQLSVGIFAEDNWKLDDQWTTNLGGRLDYIRVKNKETALFAADTNHNVGWNTHVGVTYSPAENWSHTAILATSYRAPDTLDLFKNITLGGGVTAYGNPELVPEKSYFFEYGLHYSTPQTRVSASAYYNLITDHITEKQINSTTRRMENIGEARIMGVELEGEWRIGKPWKLYGNIALTDGEDTKNNEPLAEISPVNGLIGAKYSMSNGFWTSVEMPWALKQSDVPTGTSETGTWATANLAAGYNFDYGTTRHEISVSLNNILDKQYRNHLANSRGIELLEPGFNAMATYRIVF